VKIITKSSDSIIINIELKIVGLYPKKGATPEILEGLRRPQA
jgi:hypothetical protein